EENVKIKAKLEKPTANQLPLCQFPGGKVVTMCGCEKLPDNSYKACAPSQYCVELPTNRKCFDVSALGAQKLIIGTAQVVAGQNPGDKQNILLQVTPPADLPLKDGVLTLVVGTTSSGLNVTSQANGVYQLKAGYPDDPSKAVGQNVQVRLYDRVLKDTTAIANPTTGFSLP
ncbi:MAG: hypothetical protein Q7S65_05980, partial [Nanoarchaeota archaeon]|nr:hypothetical protein [Nanoarchaeota archaeon]